MKVTRSYWLGLGSGLILSAMLTLIISPLQGQAFMPHTSQTPSSPSSVIQQTLPLTTGINKADPSPPMQPTVTPKSSQDVTSNPLDSAQTERIFVIPAGASSERIADLLIAQGIIKDKATFLETVHQMGLDTKFRAGTFNLVLGLTSEELIHRLVKE